MRSVSSGDRIHVTAFGRGWFLRRAVASEWVAACSGPELAGVFPGLVRDGDIPAIWESMLGVPDFDRRCANVARVALAQGSGREWWWAYNMITEAKAAWVHLNGELILHGVNADTTNLPDWLDAAYVQMSKLLAGDKEAQTRFNNRLGRVPTGVKGVRPKMSSRSDLQAFARD